MLLDVTASDTDGPLPLTYTWSGTVVPAFAVVTFSANNGSTTGDTVALSPPLVLERQHIDRIFGVLGDAIDAAA